MNPETQRYKDFITAWFECPTMPELCQRVGVDRRAASNMAAQVRRYGVPLPPKRPPSSHLPTRSRGCTRVIDRDALKTWAAVCADRRAAERYRRGA